VQLHLVSDIILKLKLSNIIITLLQPVSFNINVPIIRVRK